MGGERPATVKRQSCYTMPESSLQHAVSLAQKAGGEGSGKRLWENATWLANILARVSGGRVLPVISKLVAATEADQAPSALPKLREATTSRM